MGNINLDWNLVARSYDKNNDGRVDDDLNVGDTGIKTVTDLSNALSNDSVVVSNGAVQKRAPGAIQDLPVIRDFNNIHSISGQALGWGDPNYPGSQYQTTKYRTENYMADETRYRSENQMVTVTQYRSETNMIDVTKYRSETQTHDVTKQRDETIIKDETVHLKDGTVFTRHVPRTIQVPYTTQETTTVQVPYTTQEAVTSQVPYTTQQMQSVQVPYTVRVQKSRDVAYTSYAWGTAIQDVRARLQAIQAITAQSNDSSMRAMGNIASNALSQNNWEYALDEGTAHSRYVALYISLQNINQLSNAPNQPGTSVNNMNGAVVGAQTALGALKANLNNQALQGSDSVSKLQAAIQQQQDLANNTSGFWHPFKKHAAENRASQLQKELNTLQGVDPTGLTNQLSTVERRDYETTQQAWGINTIDGASQLQNDSQSVSNDANNVKNQASDQANQVQDLLNQLQTPSN
jgi:hypothetical protein